MFGTQNLNMYFFLKKGQGEKKGKRKKTLFHACKIRNFHRHLDKLVHRVHFETLKQFQPSEHSSTNNTTFHIASGKVPYFDEKRHPVTGKVIQDHR